MLFWREGERVELNQECSRAHGRILGQLAGDSLGFLVQFRLAADIGREHPGGVRLLRDGGTWNAGVAKMARSQPPPTG